MRNLLYLFIFFSLLSLHSCVQDEEEIFEKPAAERLSEVLQTYRDLLTSAENGWIMEYYPKGDCSYGGYTLLLSFTEDGVNIVSEISQVPVGSLYSLKEDMGPVLSFDTYNEIFHFFSDPAIPGLEGLGYEGDYEFIFMGQEKETILLKGKKTGNNFRMYPVPAGKSWKEVFDELNKIIRISTPPQEQCYALNIEDIPVLLTRTGRALSTETGGRNFEIDYVEGRDTLTVNAPFCYTTTGIKLYQPIEIGGNRMQSFDWSEIEQTLICTDDNVNARITFAPMKLNQKYVYTSKEWSFNTSIMSLPFREKWDAANAMVQSSQDLRIYEAYLTYNAEIEGQFLHVVLTDNSYLYECLLIVYFKAVKWTEDQVEIEFSGYGDDNGIVFYNNGGDAILEMLNGKYSISCNDPENPESFMFQAVDERDMWFQLSTQKVYNL